MRGHRLLSLVAAFAALMGSVAGTAYGQAGPPSSRSPTFPVSAAAASASGASPASSPPSPASSNSRMAATDQELASYQNAERRVRHLYWAALGRDPNDAEVGYWAGQMWSYGVPWSSVVSYFVGSSEFSNRVVSGPINGNYGLPGACP